MYEFIKFNALGYIKFIIIFYSVALITFRLNSFQDMDTGKLNCVKLIKKKY